MFVGHFFAWVTVAIMGATAAAVLRTSLSVLDPGAVTNTVFGMTGICAVVVAGWTTANPTIYRSALALNTLMPKLSHKQVTYIVGALMTILACFPGMTNIGDIVSILGWAVVGVGAICIVEHYLFPKIGYTRFWSMYKGAGRVCCIRAGTEGTRRPRRRSGSGSRRKQAGQERGLHHRSFGYRLYRSGWYRCHRTHDLHGQHDRCYLQEHCIYPDHLLLRTERYFYLHQVPERGSCPSVNQSYLTSPLKRARRQCVMHCLLCLRLFLTASRSKKNPAFRYGKAGFPLF